MTDDDPTELWWAQIDIWPVSLRIEAEVYVETRNLPGMHSYQCQWNDFVALFWRTVKGTGYDDFVQQRMRETR